MLKIFLKRTASSMSSINIFLECRGIKLYFLSETFVEVTSLPLAFALFRNYENNNL